MIIWCAMLKAILSLLNLVAGLVALAIRRKYFPSGAQKSEKVSDEIDEIKRAVAKARADGNDAYADALLRKLRKRESVFSDGGGESGRERDFSDATGGNRNQAL
ncbi:MAG: hypothetical protein ACP5TE_07675 [Verrucomicrobiia bacterium]|jgi:hypothetical protein